jgi:hypothetical protein
MSPLKQKKNNVNHSADQSSQNTTQSFAHQTAPPTSPVVRLILEQYHKSGQILTEEEATHMATSLEQFSRLTYQFLLSDQKIGDQLIMGVNS